MKTLLIPFSQTNTALVETVWWWDTLERWGLSLLEATSVWRNAETKFCNQCTELQSLRCQRLPPQSSFYEKLDPAFGRRENKLASSPDLNPTEQFWHQLEHAVPASDQHNHIGSLSTNAGWRLGLYTATIYGYVNDYYEEKVPDVYGFPCKVEATDA